MGDGQGTERTGGWHTGGMEGRNVARLERSGLVSSFLNTVLSADVIAG